MTENSPTPKEYVKKGNSIPALKWDGTLEQVPVITQWVLNYDPSAIVTATFSSDGMFLRVQTNGVVLGVYPNNYIAIIGNKVVSFSEENFLAKLITKEADPVSPKSPGNAIARLSEDK